MTVPPFSTLVLGAVAVPYAVVVLELMRRSAVSAWSAKGPGEALSPRRILVLRPCGGVDESSGKMLAKRMPWANAGEWLLVDSDADPANAVARAAIGASNEARVVAGSVDVPNPKVSLLAFAMRTAPPCDVVLVVDADVDPLSIDEHAIAAAFDDPRVAAVWQPVVEGAEGTFGDAVSDAILLGSFHAFALLALLDEGALVGKVSAVRREALEVIGGFEALGHVLGEDLELAAVLKRRGWLTRMVPRAARSAARGRSMREVFNRFARWTLVTKHQRTRQIPSYPFFFFPLPLALVLAGCTHAPETRILLAIVAVTRAIVAALGAVRGGRPSRMVRMMLLAPVADALLAAAWGTALVTRRFTWRGNVLRFRSDGSLERA